MNPIKIAIADDQVLFRKGLASLLSEMPGMEVILEAGTGLELIQRIKTLPVDVVLMDVEMPEMDGIAATMRLRVEMPHLRIVMLSAHDDEGLILHAIESGARGYLLKDSDPYEVAEAIRTVVQNGFCFNQDISHLLLRGIVEKDKLQSTFNPKPDLSERELEVLKLICLELTNAEIGDKLFLSPRTVEGHRKSLTEKIGARNTVGLVMYALKNKLVTLS